MSSVMDLRAGLEPFPGYRLQHLLGRGGFGCVWEVVGPDGKALALKFIRASDRLAATEEIRSIQRIRQLEHPNLLRLEQVWCHPGYTVIAMELAEGSLLDVFEAYQEEWGMPIPQAQVLHYLEQAASALDFLNVRQHDLNGRKVAFQHCDIKPSNLLFQNNRLKLCDFGLSSVIMGPMQSHRRAGTIDYAAPKVFQGRLSNATDQYALAVTYCLLRGGRLPFPDSPEKFQASYRRPAPDLTMLPVGERLIIARALADVPQQRWASCREMIARLRRASSTSNLEFPLERQSFVALPSNNG